MKEQTQAVTLEVRDHVGLITLCIPETRNALNASVGTRISNLCDDINSDIDIGAVVIRGAGGTFCSGANTNEWGESRTDPASNTGFAITSDIYSSFISIMELRVPTIAAIRGAAVGAGLNLALATDLRIVADNARLISGFLKIGVHPGGGFFSLMHQTGTRQTAAALGLFGQVITGTQAVQLGLAWEAQPDGEVEQRAFDLAMGAALDADLIRRAKRSLNLELGPPPITLQAALEVERGQQMWSQRRLAQDSQ